jgi:predicted nuclease of predicted toxin-antitoxin system
VKFLVDAQLPARLARLLNEHGHDATHTSELPNGNRTPDDEIADTADAEDRVVISKDRDFRNSHFLKGTPRKLLVVRTGNISNDDLLALFEANLEQIADALDGAPMAILGPKTLSVHPSKSPE